MKLTVIGSSGSFPGPDSPASCYLIQHDGTNILLDLGNGALGALQKYLDIYSLDAVFLSHLHADHCADVGSLYVSLRYHPLGVKDPIAVYGPQGTSARLVDSYGPTDDPGVLGHLNVSEYAEGDSFTVGGMTITPFGVDHVIEGFGFKVEADGRTFVYSGDTDACPELVEASRGADLVLFEAAFVESLPYQRHIHMTGRTAAQTAVDAGVERLILTHIPPWNDPAEVLADAQAVLPGAVVAYSGMEVEI
ncbi:MAG: MBL fold metallo-hydrolase [Candidatus Nanopelagicales bacterium]